MTIVLKPISFKGIIMSVLNFLKKTLGTVSDAMPTKENRAKEESEWNLYYEEVKLRILQFRHSAARPRPYVVTNEEIQREMHERFKKSDELLASAEKAHANKSASEMTAVEAELRKAIALTLY